MNYREVEFEDQFYCVIKYGESGDKKLFIIDKSNLEKITNNNSTWIDHKNHVVGSRAIIINGKRTHDYVDKTIVQKRLDIYNAKNDGEHYVVNHINNNFRDNRRINLRVVNLKIHSELVKKATEKNLPENAEIRLSDIPKCIRFHMGHGGFEINFKHDGQQYHIPLPTSKELSIYGKLENAKMKLLEFANEHPDIAESKQLLENYSEESIKLMKDYNKIIRLSRFNCVADNLVEIPRRKILTVNLESLSKSDKVILKNMQITDGTGRRCTSKLPKDCSYDISDLPEHCNYRPARDGRSDCFSIKGHPNQKKGKEIYTNGSKKMTTDEKYKQLLEMLDKLNNLKPAKPIIDI